MQLALHLKDRPRQLQPNVQHLHLQNLVNTQKHYPAQDRPGELLKLGLTFLRERSYVD